ncbi:hypothetical protein Glove_420g13 [Diversispora epigaea]|uniref:FAR1 domain-containing protein n=1 Tax=Diversispora epigaea TaxID=1348612 RepID=A0A397H0F7_9GLOM|nr:hypothetical protein Glove_420g13 [Diversispora epigaea]
MYIVNDIQDMEDIENINEDKENFFTSEDIFKDTRFDTWDEVENYFNEYGSRNGFAIVKYRMERNSKGQVYEKTFVCEFSEEAALKGLQRNTKTKKLSCPWHINLSFLEHSTKIIITTFINQHNHPLVPKTQEFATKYHTKKPSKGPISKSAFSRPRSVDNKCKSCLVCQVLVSDKSLDTYIWILEYPALDAAIPIVFPETYPAHCIFHIAQNLPKNLKGKLGEKWNDFLKQFYHCRNSLSGIESTSKQVTTSNTVSTVGQDLFPEIIKVFNKYLTEPINNIIKTEISQCLFVNANLIKPSDKELNSEQENLQKMSDGFIKDQYDARFITLQAMIEEVEKDKVLEIWKVVDIRNGVSSQESIIFNHKRDAHDNKSMDKGILSTRKPVTISTTIPTLKKAVRKRNLYGQIWGLARTATLLAITLEELNIHEMSTNDETPLINKRPEVDEIEKPANDKTSINNEIPANDKIPTNDEILVNDETPVNEISAIDERLISNDACKIDSNINTELENNNQMEENEDKTKQDNEIIKMNLKNKNFLEEDPKLEIFTDVVYVIKWDTMLLFIRVWNSFPDLKFH